MIGAKKQRHPVAKLSKETGDVHVSLFDCENRDGLGPVAGQSLTVIESKPIEKSLVSLGPIQLLITVSLLRAGACGAKLGSYRPSFIRVCPLD